ncbi:hypothetical protein RHSIM_Rhsim11G0190600 [Rhododendron simsii]|uniref:U6 small nuclear RNA (adenine-(43)-N(6))-methyltransferase n=1 Tax=Rhododendron simsii TaxID=118357 RepID=A0A834GC15_RHOSS|nr:hypothetical protein RHSIM_Rhsim11G0190600 [Rhododendron simsii]
MGSKKKRKRGVVLVERPTIHPRNKYSDNPPDFAQLASLYPSFEPFVFYSRDGRPRIDWTDFNATRELTRVLLLHDHSLNWYSFHLLLKSYVEYREMFLFWKYVWFSSNGPLPYCDGEVVRGFDIGTGANCIYPLLGASLLGWSFVGSDVTDVALEWAERNVKNNPHISGLIEIRKVESGKMTSYGEESCEGQLVDSGSNTLTHEIEARNPEPDILRPLELHSNVNKSYHGPPVLYGVVRDGEEFDFCMCNPPFFESMEEAGLNPKTSCGGTLEEMVCPGGEEAFISRIIQDSFELMQSIRWYTSMVGRKSNMKILMSKLREVGVTIVKTTEFVQGQTCRWGLAWSFMPPAQKVVSSHVAEKSVLSFMLEGLQRQYSAIHVLQSVETFFCGAGATCKSNASAFTLDITASNDHFDAILKNELSNLSEPAPCQYKEVLSNGSDCSPLPLNDLSLRITVFQQIPGTLLVRGSLQHRESPAAGAFPLIFLRLEEVLKLKFCREKAPAGA